MAISFQNALGIHEETLNLRSRRAEVLANNLANADTPGYKARDLDFKAILQGQVDDSLAMSGTRERHIVASASADAELKYRNPLQPSLDGNTVDTQLEMAEFMRNSMDYNASFQFLNSKFKGLMNAIKGE